MVRPDLEGGSAAASQVAAVQPESRAVDLQEEYHYVITDLKRIGIIAAVMLSLLIVLALVLV